MSADNTRSVTSPLDLLRCGDLELLGRMPWSSNQTFLGRLTHQEHAALAIYKPRRGERALWDFPPGTLCQREVAAYLVSEALGWSIVPPTVLREGPGGGGMAQLFVDHDPDQHYFTLRERYPNRFRQFALFDVITNNADRKSGHCLLDGDGHLWGIDHGLSFHVAPKLRTVIWDFEGEPIHHGLLGELAAMADTLAGDLASPLGRLLAPGEVEATAGRLAWLLEFEVFPPPLSEYPYPWPMV
ncbi:MAG: SCO1664 family protein [Acidimicrobiia bacterium]